MSNTASLQTANANTQPASGQGSLLQRKCACGGSAGLSGECEECSKKKMSGIQAKLKVSELGDVYEQEADRIADQVLAAPAHSMISGALTSIQRYAGQPTGQAETAPSSVDHALASPGRPLEPTLKQDMEQRFGFDFSRVRVHSGAAAEKSARDVNAHAYTVGSHIVFGSQQYRPGTSAGNRLLAHELAHTIQQGAVRPPDAGALHNGAPDDGSERIGDRLADRVASGRSLAGLALGAVEPSLQRDCGPAIGSVGGCIARGGDVTDFGESSDSIYLFDRNCNDFALDEQARLEEYARTIAFDARVDINGFASEEGEPGFNENLSCARAQRVQEVISDVTGVQTTVYKHGATPGDRETRRSAVITLRTAESEPEPVNGEAPVPTESVPAAPALPVPPEECTPVSARETVEGCTPNPHGSHLPPVGRTHTEAHALEPCLLTQADVAASADWCVDRTQGHGGEICYRDIPTTAGAPGNQFCYSLNCCHNSPDLVTVVDPASAGSGACCDNAGTRTTLEHIWEDVVPEAQHDPLRVGEDLLESLLGQDLF